MKPNEHHPVHSPYVVVLGGNSVRRKSTPPPNAPTHLPAPEQPLPHVYGVLPPLKTMSQDLRKATPIVSSEKKKSWWSNLGKKKKKEEALAPLNRNIIDIPAEPKPVAQSAYHGKFMRGLAKKAYLKSKLAVELPIHAKVGMGIALLVLVVGVPVISRFIQKPAPVTAGSVVAMGTEALVAQVGKSIELPVGETPLVVIATADDIRRLNVPDSKPGNKVLLYQKTGKIVVYDAEKDKVLGVVNRTQP